MGKLDLAGLVGARICHDLISPIGAIGNGVELLTLTGGPPSPEMKLISDSVAGASARVKFLRIAFGRSDPGQSIGAEEVRGVLRDIASGGKIRYDWQATGPVPRQEVRCAFLALLCVQHAMPVGGDITISGSGGVWHVNGLVTPARIVPELWARIDGEEPEEPLSPNDVHFALLPDCARAIGRTARWAERSGGVAITF